MLSPARRFSFHINRTTSASKVPTNSHCAETKIRNWVMSLLGCSYSGCIQDKVNREGGSIHGNGQAQKSRPQAASYNRMHQGAGAIKKSLQLSAAVVLLPLIELSPI